MKKNFDPNRINKLKHPFFEENFYRLISNRLTPLVAKVTSSPNLVSFIGFLIGLCGLVLIATGDYYWAIGGSLILIFSYVLDCVDGELARGFQAESRFGHLLDTTLDSIKESLIFFALAWNYYLNTQDEYILLYLLLILLLQRLFGRTLPWFRLIFGQTLGEIKISTLENLPKLLKILAIFFSESYRSGTIWLIVFLGIITNQIKLTFIYFVVVLTALFFFLLFKSYLQDKDV